MKHQRIVLACLAAFIGHALVLLMLPSKPVTDPVPVARNLVMVLEPKTTPAAEVEEAPPQLQPQIPPELPAEPEVRPVTPEPQPDRPEPQQAQEPVLPQAREQIIEEIVEMQAVTPAVTPSTDAEELMQAFRPGLSQRYQRRVIGQARRALLADRTVASEGLSPEAYNALGAANNGVIKTAHGCGRALPDTSAGSNGAAGGERRWWWTSCNETLTSKWQLPTLEVDANHRARLP